MNFSEVFENQKKFFRSRETRSYDFRVAQLKKLKKLIKEHEEEIATALQKDLGKSHFEAFGSEIGACLQEITHVLKSLKEWMADKKVSTGILNFPSSGKIISEPYGNVLIVAPWNYPFLLGISPALGAIAAGNTVFLKSSDLTPHTSGVIKKMINNNFDPEFFVVVDSGVEETTEILKLPFDYLFFTGSPQVGKIMMEAAAKNLTPVTLELGGKSPCIIDENVDLEVAVRRIIWGKFFNAGQTCIAPDYLYVHEKHYEEFFKIAKQIITEFYSENPKSSEDFGRIVNERHFDRIMTLINQDKVVIGGDSDIETKYIAPTIMKDVSWDDEVMKSEIFGPILPVMKFQDLPEVIDQINDHPKPLAFYFFSNSGSRKNKLLKECSFGGGCINDTLVHLAENDLPFGGVGNSGMGSYHGKKSFDTFSHHKSVLFRETWYDNPVRYAPYKDKIKFLKMLFR